MNWFYQYSIGEFLEAISIRGKFFEAVGPLVKLEISILKGVLKEAFAPLLMVSPGLSKIGKAIDEFEGFKPFEDFDENQVPFVIENVKKLVKTDHDKMDLMSATRIPSIIWQVLNRISITSMNQDSVEVIKDLQYLITQLDLIHGMSPEIPEEIQKKYDEENDSSIKKPIC
jgi:hypothetical protein